MLLLYLVPPRIHQYCKPPALLELEEKARRERAHMQFQEDGEMKNDCKQQ